MNIMEMLDFIKEAKQPVAYFDHDGERYRFRNLEIKDGKTIYNYLGEKQEIQVSVKRG